MSQWKKRFSTILFGVCLSSILSHGAFTVPSATILYIAEDGNDAWTGKLPSPNNDRTDGPLVSLERARDAIRSLKVYGKLESPVKVMVRGGTYRLNKTFILEAQDSGSKNCPIEYKAYPGEKVVISGGKEIKRSWQTFKDNIVFCTIPEVKEGTWHFRELFVNGKRQRRARTPDSGFFYIAGFVSGKDSSSAFRYRPDDLKRWRNLTDVELLIYQSWDASRINISDIDETNKIVKLRRNANYPLQMWSRYYAKYFPEPYARYRVENVFEGLDSPGEWYLDKNTGNLYFLPPAGGKVADMEVIAPALKRLVLLQGDTLNRKPVSFVSLSGFTFCETDWPGGWQGFWGDEIRPAAITLSYAEHCTIEKNTITNIGTYAIENVDKSAYNTFDRNGISHTGSGGIRVGESFYYKDGVLQRYPVYWASSPDGAIKRNVISNNHIHHCGMVHPSAIGICVGCSPQNIITHNHLHDIGYIGISCRGNPSHGNIIDYNHIHHVMYDLCDGGAVFIYSQFTDGILIRNNLFHDIKPFAFFGWGIYLDFISQNVTVMDNVVYRCQWGNSMNNPRGKNNHWINNIFVDGGQAQIYWGTQNTPENNTFVQNIVYYSNPNAFLIDVEGDALIKNKMVEMDYNLYYCTRGGARDMKIRRWDQSDEEFKTMEIQSLYDWQRLGYDFHSVIADPLFVDTVNDNYTLREESPAFKLGFRQIDLSTVGPQD